MKLLKAAQHFQNLVLILALHVKHTMGSTSAFRCSHIPSLFICNTSNNSGARLSNSCNKPFGHCFSRQIIHRPSFTRHYSTKDEGKNYNPNQSSNENDESDEYYVTDEEALLACRAYLQRKNRVGWTQSKR